MEIISKRCPDCWAKFGFAILGENDLEGEGCLEGPKMTAGGECPDGGNVKAKRGKK